MNLFAAPQSSSEGDNSSVLKAPDFTLTSKHASGAERGTATHVFMQFCDFNQLEVNGVEAEI